MSIRTDRDATSANMPHAGPNPCIAQDALATIGAAQAADGALSEANQFNTNSPEHPLERTIVVGIRASLDALCLQKSKGTWAPTNDALKSILQQSKFVDLSGTSERVGDLKSVVLHSVTMASCKSSFPVALGLNATGVDNNAYAITGEPFGAVVLPETSGAGTQLLQEDDCSLAYEFARKFPGYTSENISEKGIHEVVARKFCLVAAGKLALSWHSTRDTHTCLAKTTLSPTLVCAQITRSSRR